jgi:2-polyprenyl-6-methoxyphenol hydroxylase-like FAD-dependent oxidoreductase
MKAVELKHKFATIAIHRADLQGFLYKNILKDVVKAGHVFSHYEEKNETIIAHFSNGFQVEGDILIAADGIHSKVREQLLGKTAYRYSGQTCWRFITDFQLNDQHTAYEYWANQAGLRVGTVQINDKQVYTFITKKTASGGKDDKISIKKELLERCEVFNDEIKNIIQNTDSQRIIRNDIFNFVPIKKWHRGKIVLLGDAAHATTPNMGQGACQAIEDAYAIAECLAKTENATSAFEEFQKSRIEKAHYVVNTSWMIGKLTNTSGF